MNPGQKNFKVRRPEYGEYNRAYTVQVPNSQRE
jgi:hypothetical protein